MPNNKVITTFSLFSELNNLLLLLLLLLLFFTFVYFVLEFTRYFFYSFYSSYCWFPKMCLFVLEYLSLHSFRLCFKIVKKRISWWLIIWFITLDIFIDRQSFTSNIVRRRSCKRFVPKTWTFLQELAYDFLLHLICFSSSFLKSQIYETHCNFFCLPKRFSSIFLLKLFF